MTTDDAYLKKLVNACAVLIAESAGADVDFDELEFAILRMRNHLVILTTQYKDELDPSAHVK